MRGLSMKSTTGEMPGYVIPSGWIFLTVVVIALTLLPGFNHGIWKPDEPLVAGISAEMSRTKDFVVPRLNGEPFLEKPPLYYAAGALSGMVIGPENEASYRLVSVVFGLLTLCTTFAIVRRRSGIMAGLIAAGVLASSWQFFMVSRWIQVDSALTFAVTFSLYAYLRLKQSGSSLDALILGSAIGLSFMAKGFVGPAILAAMIAGDMLLRRDYTLLRGLNPATIVLFFCLAMLPWTAALYFQGGWPFVREVLVVNNLMRFLGSPEGAALGHQHGFFYYLQSLPRNLIPWTLVFIPAFVFSVKNIRTDPYAILFMAPLILLSISSTKRSVYLAPLYPVMACMIAHWMQAGAKKTWELILFKATWALAVAGCFAPFAGIFLDRTTLGLIMGALSTAFLLVVWRRTVIFQASSMLPLVLLICIGLSTTMSVYFSYMKPKEDYLAYTHEALASARGDDIIIYLGEDEILEGLFPMVSGKRYTVTRADRELAPGLYAWIDTRKGRGIAELRSKGRLDIRLEETVGSKKAYLAVFEPGPEDDKPLQSN